ncbi:MAG TPA: hypothetical protein VNE41_12480, partial [Chitinophagaceae bacterium]|nr:hypothetical protein [Chitinophagaceae bacterium]
FGKLRMLNKQERRENNKTANKNDQSVFEYSEPSPMTSMFEGTLFKYADIISSFPNGRSRFLFHPPQIR